MLTNMFKNGYLFIYLMVYVVCDTFDLGDGCGLKLLRIGFAVFLLLVGMDIQIPFVVLMH